MADVNLDLLIPILLRIHPKVGKRRFEKASADAVEVRYIVPFLLACVEDLGEVGPFGDVGLHEQNVWFGRGEAVIVGGGLEVCDQDPRAERIALFCEGEADAWGCQSGDSDDTSGQMWIESGVCTRCSSSDQDDLALERHIY